MQSSYACETLIEQYEVNMCNNNIAKTQNGKSLFQGFARIVVRIYRANLVVPVGAIGLIFTIALVGTWGQRGRSSSKLSSSSSSMAMRNTIDIHIWIYLLNMFGKVIGIEKAA